MDALLSVSLSVDYPGKPGVLRHASFEVAPGEIVGLVGQSGSGKSTIALSILQLLPFKGGRASGAIYFQGRNLLACGEREMNRIRGARIGFVSQSPMAALNPALRIGTQLREAWDAHAKSGAGFDAAVPQLFADLDLPAEPAFLRRYPRELSVGQAQRVLIAMSVLHQPALLIADEPTSSLDVITNAEVLKLLAGLNRRTGMGILYISHDLLSVASLCHRIAILHEGSIVEYGEAATLMSRPSHPYTRRLIEAIPRHPLPGKLPV